MPGLFAKTGHLSPGVLPRPSGARGAGCRLRVAPRDPAAPAECRALCKDRALVARCVAPTKRRARRGLSNEGQTLLRGSDPSLRVVPRERTAPAKCQALSKDRAFVRLVCCRDQAA